MFQFFKRSLNNRHIARYRSVARRINKISINLKGLPDIELSNRTKEFKRRLSAGETLDQLMEEAFALVKEGTYRVLGLTMFEVQLIGGIILHEGKIAEMRTGEGKTLVSVLPTYLNALLGKGVHIITVNDYLAKRDAEWVGKIHKFLGLTVGLVRSEMTYNDRKRNYLCDITYVTNSQLGFDYLRDNMAISEVEIVQRPLFFGIIDEVDSILIDEARTPLIISGPSEAPTEKYLITTELSQELTKNIDYEVDEKARNITLTDKGILFCEKILNVQDLYDLNNPWAQYILNSLRAKELFIKNTHYIVQDSKIVIVDEFTGRIMEGRRWSDGLHQAIEAKENVIIQRENQTLASITYQNFFLLYEKIAGMTGTAKTEEKELNRIYQLEVIEVPTNKPCIRQDFPDLVYSNEHNKWKAIANECLNMYKIGRPTLVGTSSIEKSELLARILDKYSLPYNLLNAKPENVKRESEIIAQAGRKFGITIATNMAGRGTDIILGGNIEEFAKSLLILYLHRKFNLKTKVLNRDINDVDFSRVKLILKDLFQKYQHSINNDQLLLESSITRVIDLNIATAPEDNLLKSAYLKIIDEYQKIFDNEKQQVIQLGGLHVIGTERHESRRIDNQLRGRAGRQGDPGSSRFFLSLEDNLLRIFGGDKIKSFMEMLDLEEDTALESRLVSRSLNSAQQKVESYFYDIRRQLFEYDEVLNDQRQAIYAERSRILKSNYCRDCIIEYAESTVDEFLRLYQQSSQIYNNGIHVLMTLKSILNLTNNFKPEYYVTLSKEQLHNFFYEQANVSYDLQEIYLDKVRPGLIRELEKYYLLQQIDSGWQKHLEHMSCLRESIGLRSYAQQDPLTEYKNEAFNLFISMVSYVRQTVVFLILNTK